MMETCFDPGLDIEIIHKSMDYRYGRGVFGPEPEKRRLADIRGSLMDPECDGPDPVYSIVMDVGKMEHLPLLRERNLLFGVVTYAEGRLGKEPVRSQGHVHGVSAVCGMSTPEVYEIWEGEALIYMQEFAQDNPGRCFAIKAGPGGVVIVPPCWCHATISANPGKPLVFGAWCVRDYCFNYEDVRAHGGIAWFPLFDDNGTITWRRNENYFPSELTIKAPGEHPELGIIPGIPIYRIFETNPETFRYVAQPDIKKEIWEKFIP